MKSIIRNPKNYHDTQLVIYTNPIKKEEDCPLKKYTDKDKKLHAKMLRWRQNMCIVKRAHTMPLIRAVFG